MNPYQRGQKALCGDYFKFTLDGASQFKRAGRLMEKAFLPSMDDTLKNQSRVT